MARLQSLKQSRFLESSDSPITNTQLEGGFHSRYVGSRPLSSGSLNTISKASGLMHGLRLKKFKMPRLRMPGMKGLPRL